MFVRIRQLAKSGDLYALLFLFAWPLIYYWPVTIGQKAFSEGDLYWLFLPIHSELARSLAKGQLPLWSPGVQAGYPLFADGQVAALYPINLILHLFLSVPFALSYGILFDVIWCSIGMYLLVRSAGSRVVSALLAGFVFSSVGFVTAHLSHVTILSIASWLPWLIFFQLRYWKARGSNQKSTPWFLLGVLGIGLQFLGGSPPIALLDLLAFAWFGCLYPFLDWNRRDRQMKGDRGDSPMRLLIESAGITFLAIILGTSLAAIQLLPTAELTSLSIRAQEMGRSFFTSYSLEPLAITQLLVPFGYLGKPDASNMEFWSYMGVLPVLLAISAPFLRRDRQTLFIFLFGVLMLSLALGGVNPLYNLLYYVPVFNRFRVPARFLLLFAFSVAWLAAVGFDELLTRLKPSLRLTWKSSVPAAMLVALIMGVIFLIYSQPAEFWLAAWQLLPVLLIIAAISTIIAARKRVVDRASFAIIVLGLSVFDLAAFSAPFLATLTRMASPGELVQVPRTVLAMDAGRTPYRVFVNRFPSVTDASIRATLWSGLPLVYDREGVIVGYNPFTLALQRNELFVKNMSLGMRDLINIRYYLLPLETAPVGASSPFDLNEPNGGLTLNLLTQQPEIPPTNVTQVELVSYTNQSSNLPNGFLAGELLLRSNNGSIDALPIRLGQETADWAYDGIGKMNHSKPAHSISFQAYLASVGHAFQGNKYIARYDLGFGMTVTAVGVRSFLPDADLTVESVSLIDAQGHAVSLASLLHRNDLALVFRSHTAAMWENRSVLPRAFVVHSAEVVDDDQILAKLEQPDFRADQVVLLADTKSTTPRNDTVPKDQKDQVTIANYESDRVVVKVNTASSGYLVLTDSWYPGWEVTVDGQRGEIRRADYIFRAVQLQAGEHTIVFEYHPLSFAIGALVSGLSLIVCLLLAIVSYFHSSRHSRRTRTIETS